MPRAIERPPCTVRAQCSAAFIHQVSPAGGRPSSCMWHRRRALSNEHRAPCVRSVPLRSLPQRLRVATGHLVSPSSFRAPWRTCMSRSQRRSPARASPSNRPASATRAASTSSPVATPPCAPHPHVPPRPLCLSSPRNPSHLRRVTAATSLRSRIPASPPHRQAHDAILTPTGDAIFDARVRAGIRCALSSSRRQAIARAVAARPSPWLHGRK